MMTLALFESQIWWLTRAAAATPPSDRWQVLRITCTCFIRPEYDSRMLKQNM
jgi:hypothetical protein